MKKGRTEKIGLRNRKVHSHRSSGDPRESSVILFAPKSGRIPKGKFFSDIVRNVIYLRWIAALGVTLLFLGWLRRMLCTNGVI